MLDFDAWLPADQAEALAAHVALLRERGQGFRQDLISLGGRHLEAEGRAIGGRVVLRMRDVSGDRLELVRLRENQSRQTAQLENLARACSICRRIRFGRAGRNRIWSGSMRPMPMRWTPKIPRDAVARQLELLDRQALRRRDAGARGRARSGGSGSIWWWRASDG